MYVYNTWQYMYITWQHPSARRNTFASLGQASTASHGSDWSNFSDPSKKQLHVWLCPCTDPVSGPGRAGSWATRHVVNGIFQLTCEKCSKERLWMYIIYILHMRRYALDIPIYYLLVLSREWGNDPKSLVIIIPFPDSPIPPFPSIPIHSLLSTSKIKSKIQLKC